MFTSILRGRFPIRLDVLLVWNCVEISQPRLSVFFHEMKAFKVPSAPNASKKSLLHILAAAEPSLRFTSQSNLEKVRLGSHCGQRRPTHRYSQPWALLLTGTSNHLAASALYGTPKYAEVVDKSSQYAFDIFVSVHFHALVFPQKPAMKTKMNSEESRPNTFWNQGKRGWLRVRTYPQHLPGSYSSMGDAGTDMNLAGWENTHPKRKLTKLTVAGSAIYHDLHWWGHILSWPIDERK